MICNTLVKSLITIFLARIFYLHRPCELIIILQELVDLLKARLYDNSERTRSFELRLSAVKDCTVSVCRLFPALESSTAQADVLAFIFFNNFRRGSSSLTTLTIVALPIIAILDFIV